jgi:hypothetical protein
MRMERQATREAVGGPNKVKISLCVPNLEKGKRRTVRPDRLPVRRTDAEDGGHDEVLERRDEEEGRVLIVKRLELVDVYIGLGVPRLHSNQEEDTELDESVDERLRDNARQDSLGNEGSGWSLGMDLGEGESSAHCRNRRNNVKTRKKSRRRKGERERTNWRRRRG